MTADALRAYLSSPAGLFVLMLLASVANGSKQLVVIRQTSNAMTCLQYWAHIPETLTTLIGNIIAFAALVMWDQLNFASALAVGYGVNSLADLIPKGRSYALKQTPDNPTKIDPPSKDIP